MPIPACPVCAMEHTYQDENLYICPDCTHEWEMDEVADNDNDERVVQDAHGSPLTNGDAVFVIKDLKVKGSSTILKKGTKIKGIRLISGDHEIDCKVDGVSFKLKAAFLKKA
ncbi:zinc ribbon domain-containing protein YjdM [Allopusillimonas ginsengisoli]|uniref:zinc ribbon domain-containing protein YjdM n=1 Tax=Allopusillimonas ginsengisoli TaxID=453575 RepID=UPI0010219BDA|nr:zinc ribbon domain-containing protein YjdM [Allopusillimonas ginsengisoli]TEA78801.1 alkylphosphonate utilization protein [Allopusillimonas ginsengisoli]